MNKLWNYTQTNQLPPLLFFSGKNMQHSLTVDDFLEGLYRSTHTQRHKSWTLDAQSILITSFILAQEDTGAVSRKQCGFDC